MTNKVWLHPNKTASELTLKGQQWQRIWCALQLRVAKHACLNDGTRVCPHSTYSIRIWIYIYSGLENHWVYQFIIQNFWRFTWINQPPSHGGLYPSMIRGALEALVTCFSVSLSSFVSWWFLVGRERRLGKLQDLTLIGIFPSKSNENKGFEWKLWELQWYLSIVIPKKAPFPSPYIYQNEKTHDCFYRICLHFLFGKINVYYQLPTLLKTCIWTARTKAVTNLILNTWFALKTYFLLNSTTTSHSLTDIFNTHAPLLFLKNRFYEIKQLLPTFDSEKINYNIISSFFEKQVVGDGDKTIPWQYSSTSTLRKHIHFPLVRNQHFHGLELSVSIHGVISYFSKPSHFSFKEKVNCKRQSSYFTVYTCAVCSFRIVLFM